MRAIIRALYSSDVDVDSYVSPNPHNDGIWIRLLIGPLGEGGEESFDVLVCTPTWLQSVVEHEGPQLGRHRLVMAQLDLAEAANFLRALIESLEAPNWTILAEKISRIGFWEFEDYRE